MFIRRWVVFKQGSKLSKATASTRFFQCASQVLGDTLLKLNANVLDEPLDALLLAMCDLAAIVVAAGVLRAELKAMRHMREEQFRAITSRMRGKTDTFFLPTGAAVVKRIIPST